ncbi:MAG: PAS domain S-box protein, partial [Anaerolineaceae bacterium]|nr:PAS domain S-box protein [Anaerolineaceae bacterium]
MNSNNRIEVDNLLKQMVGFTEELLKIGDEQVTYQKILENLLFLSKAKYGALTLLDDSTGIFTTVAVAGMKNKLKQAVKILGFELVGKEWPEYSTENEQLQGKIVARFSSMSELAGRVIPEIITKPIEKLLDMGEVTVTKVIVNKQMIGDFTLIMPSGKHIENDYLVEIYSRQIDMFITRIMADEGLRESEENLKRLADAAWEAIVIHDAGIVLEANTQYFEMFGYEREELIGQEGISRTTILESSETIRQKIATGNMGPYNAIGRRKDGTEFPMEIQVRRIDYAGREVRVAAIRDITERKQAEEALRESLTNLGEAQRMAHIGSWEWDMLLNTLTWSEEMYRVFDISPDAFERKAESLLEVIHPEDVESYTNAMADNLATGSSPALEYRVIHKDGSIHTVFAEGKMEFDSAGKPIKSRGTVQDITERKKAEEELKRSKTFLDNMSDIAYTTDDQGNLVWANSASERITGLSLEKNIGKPFLFLFIEDDHQSLIDIYTRTLMGESLENTLTFASGVTCHFTSLPDRDSNGKITGTFGVARNITERLAMERALQVSENRLKKAQSVAQLGSWDYDISTGKVWGSEEAFRLYGIERKSEFLPLDEVEAQIIEAERVNQALVDLVTLGKEYNIEYQITQKNSKESITLHSLAELVKDDEGNPIKVTGVIQDITKRKQAEEIALTSQKMASIGNLAAGMAHEINNPLQVVTG